MNGDWLIDLALVIFLGVWMIYRDRRDRPKTVIKERKAKQEDGRYRVIILQCKLLQGTGMGSIIASLLIKARPIVPAEGNTVVLIAECLLIGGLVILLVGYLLETYYKKLRSIARE